MTSRLTHALIAAALAVFVVAATPQRATTAPNVTSFKLANGLEVVVIPGRRTPVVTHMLW